MEFIIWRCMGSVQEMYSSCETSQPNWIISTIVFHNKKTRTLQPNYLQQFLFSSCFPMSKLFSFLLYPLLQLNLQHKKTSGTCIQNNIKKKEVKYVSNEDQNLTFCALMHCISSSNFLAASSLFCFCFRSWTWFSCFFLRSCICCVQMAKYLRKRI